MGDGRAASLLQRYQPSVVCVCGDIVRLSLRVTWCTGPCLWWWSDTESAGDLLSRPCPQGSAWTGRPLPGRAERAAAGDGHGRRRRSRLGGSGGAVPLSARVHRTVL